MKSEIVTIQVQDIVVLFMMEQKVVSSNFWVCGNKIYSKTYVTCDPPYGAITQSGGDNIDRDPLRSRREL